MYFGVPRNMLEEFLENNRDWEQRFQAEPYCVSVKHDGDFAILKYQQLNSDFGEPLTHLCRGTIVHVPTGRIVCMPFIKFFNYGEPYAHDIDWKTATVTEKIDGSLMKLWCFEGKWHLSTNGTVDAYKASAGETEETFGEMFERILGMPVADFADTYLDKRYCYMFEMTAPENRVVVEYTEPHLWLLAIRDMETLVELPVPNGLLTEAGILHPKRYRLCTLEECIRAVGEFDRSHEGVVVCDGAYNRIKIKSPEYLAMAHAANNGKITTRRIVQMIQKETVDDFLAMLPQYATRVEEVRDAIRRHERRLAEAWQGVSQVKCGTRFEVFTLCRERNGKDCTDFVMKMYDGKVADANEYMQRMKQSVLLGVVRKEMEER